MKSSLTSLDINCLVEELRPEIIGSWLNNVYNIGEKLLILKFRKSSKINFELIIELGKRFHITKYARSKPPAPNNKVAMMRKHIKGLPVDDFYQIGLDRIIVFEIAYKDSHYKLVIELFGEGNYILVDPANRILVAQTYRKMRDRDIHPGKEFFLPPQQEKDILSISKDDILESLSSKEEKIIPLLNKLLGLGPKYSKNILDKAKINNKVTTELTTNEKESLIKEILELKKIIEEKRYSPVEYFDGEEVIDISPIPIEKYNDLEKKELDSFNDALDDFFTENEETPEFEKTEGKIKSTQSKHEKILQNQIEHKKKLELQEELERKKGDLLYAHFSLVDELLNTIIKARKNNVPWSEIEKKMDEAKKKNIPAALILHKINPKTKEIWVKLEDLETGENEIIVLDFTLSVADNANKFYEKSKKARRKIPGAIQAIERTKQQIEKMKEKGEQLLTEKETRKMVEKRPKRWFEKFHWFLCDDTVIVGGKDAKSNERLLKTYLEDDDLFFHADVHGAPYVIAKDGRKKLSDECVKEIAAFALSFSSLWKAKKLVGDVYYVNPDQVSLSAPSGQYLAKGSVMIYGEKNYVKNVEVNHVLGLIIHENYAQVIGGPMRSVDNKTDMIIRLKPGEISKGKIAKIIKQKFIEMCPEEDKYKVEALDINEIMDFIPGDSEIIE
ncbi:MAG: NFACT family protein [Candidatus Heimdallarchaeum aukensis]|uniref:NFACT family protein n=1 Tax=Candidatus Heimdallarchaeum aukensis TaxID=2876573 RepID=A0A9Y1BL89_9ARCH|nr:MAG: NFACT family protein [Candidatus Heimdallarchaeum aukensis]